MIKQSDAIRRLCDQSSKVSSHYFITNNGKIIMMVPDLYQAWHAGVSEWKNFKSLNKYSIGIEINNPGHEYGYKNFNLKQIKSLKKLLKNLMKKYKIKKNNILGHSDIAPSRKKDPGEKFPWFDLSKSNLSYWHNLDMKKLKDYRKIKLKLYEEKIFFKNLYKIGYSKINRTKLVKAFQRRFRQSLINGKIDQECLKISENLVTTKNFLT
tara:strand:+ start:126 stop:755 length:630 start_codon:yes stop_codon:yes gene_type:complete